MGNEEQQSPQTSQDSSEQQEYFGWQYDPDATQIAPRRPLHDARLSNAEQSKQPQEKSRQGQSVYEELPTPASEKFQRPIQDMGTTLSVNQGTEYLYFNVPQPSQPIAQLRQERLQQLREERMRRQQRRMRPDVSTIFPWNKQVPQSPALPDSPDQQARPSEGQADAAFSSADLLSSGIDQSVEPVRISTQRPDGLKIAPSTPGTVGLQRAASSAQDTGMVQKVRIGRATMILTIAFVASRVLGLLRTSMFAFVFGTSVTSDAYLQAFLLPDLIFNIVAGGALSSAFIPVFTSFKIGAKDEKSAWHIASSALNLALAIMCVLALFAIIFARQLVPLYNPDESPQELTLIISLTRIMLLQSIVLGGGVMVTSVLNAEQDFRSPALGTVLYNVGLILGLLPGIFFAVVGQRNNMVSVQCATWGVVLGAILSVGVQIPGLFKIKMQYSFAFDWRHPGVLQIGRQMIPRIGNAAMIYLSTFVDRSLILLLTDVAGTAVVGGLITQYYQALQLVLLPYGIFGLSIATAAFPTLAENVTKGRFDRYRNTILETLRSIIFMSIPSSVGLIVLGLPIIQVLLQHGEYSLNDATATAVPLAFFALGLCGLSSIEILTRSFYAMRDTRTPVIVSVLQFIFKIMLSLILINVAAFGAVWGVGALAFSTALANTLEALGLYWILHNRVGGMQPKQIGVFLVRVLIAALVMGVALVVVRLLLDKVLVTTNSQSMGLTGTLMAFVKLLIELFVGLFIYIRGARMLGVGELGPVKRILDRLKLSWI
ncbi:MAG TPA: murein biosynthesis integral membrane protein MurJ [Dictyobacter sp.]|nr:murein biosynthesis integral membrane protein MurJ [Dictyobacter sp.]